MENSATFGTGSASGSTPHATEGEVTKRIEAVTAKVPSLGYLGLAIGSMAISAGLALMTERKSLANFFGLWVPSFMLMGIYNKLVKLEGSDYETNPNLH